mmetsp:Transcript_77563/g.136862  ORF Transcript_77563/g.136862 Transcript_77563/m.136862 type:complete len:216 (+) Transcript_77563:26-673(+)
MLIQSTSAAAAEMPLRPPVQPAPPASATAASAAIGAGLAGRAARLRRRIAAATAASPASSPRPVRRVLTGVVPRDPFSVSSDSALAEVLADDTGAAAVAAAELAPSRRSFRGCSSTSRQQASNEAANSRKTTKNRSTAASSLSLVAVTEDGPGPFSCFRSPKYSSKRKAFVKASAISASSLLESSLESSASRRKVSKGPGLAGLVLSLSVLLSKR